MCNFLGFIGSVKFLSMIGSKNDFIWQTKDGSGDAPIPPVKDVAQFHVAHARSSKVLLVDSYAPLFGNMLNIVF
jgi:hypothetical protein